MRTRKEIENAAYEARNEDYQLKGSSNATSEQILEVLLDIRDLLANPPVEISGKSMTDKDYRDLFNPPSIL